MTNVGTANLSDEMNTGTNMYDTGLLNFPETDQTLITSGVNAMPAEMINF